MKKALHPVSQRVIQSIREKVESHRSCENDTASVCVHFCNEFDKAWRARKWNQAACAAFEVGRIWGEILANSSASATSRRGQVLALKAKRKKIPDRDAAVRQIWDSLGNQQKIPTLIGELVKRGFTRGLDPKTLRGSLARTEKSD